MTPSDDTRTEDLRLLSEGLADEDVTVREACAQRMAELRDPEAAPFLRHALDDDAEEVRVWGAYGLSLLRRPEDRDELVRASEKDGSPLVRVWATFGRANLGETGAVATLLTFLDLPDLEVKSNAADALLSLDDASEVRPLLERRLEGDDRKRVWAAALLHRLGHSRAFGIWREGLVAPETRVDAAMAATQLQSIDAARELVRVTAELTQEALEAPVPAANDLPLAELLTTPLLELDLPALLEHARKDAALRHDLLLVLLRGPGIDPEVQSQLFEFASSLDPAKLGADAADLVAEQDPAARPLLLARLADIAAPAALAALERLEGAERDALFDRVAAAAEAPDEANSHLSPLLDLLRESPWHEQFADLPENPWGALGEGDEPGEIEDDGEDVGLLIERMAAHDETLTDEERAKAQALLDELEMTPEEFVASLEAAVDESELESEPPEPEQVALRALAVAAVYHRSRTEKALQEGDLSKSEAAPKVAALQAWLEQEGISDVLSPLEDDLLRVDAGDWVDEDVTLAEAGVEGLAILMWVLGLAGAPTPGRRAAPDPLLAKVPLLKPTESFVAGASPRPPEALSEVRELYEAIVTGLEHESTARMLLEGMDVDPGLDLEEIRDALIADGLHPSAPPAEALRFLARRAAENLGFEHQFEGTPVEQLDDDGLMLALTVARDRLRALEWVATGGDWDEYTMELTDSSEAG